MPAQIGFLRAVNLGKRRVPMARLAELTTGLGFRDVWTYVNSGNVVFRATGARSKLEHALEAALEDDLGFEVTTFVRTAPELRQAVELEPFDLGPDDTYFVTFLKDRLSRSQAGALEALSNDFDTLSVVGRDVHWHMRGRSIDTKLPTRAWEEVVGRHRSTSRNMNMLRRLTRKIETAQQGS